MKGVGWRQSGGEQQQHSRRKRGTLNTEANQAGCSHNSSAVTGALSQRSFSTLQLSSSRTKDRKRSSSVTAAASSCSPHTAHPTHPRCRVVLCCAVAPPCVAFCPGLCRCSRSCRLQTRWSRWWTRAFMASTFFTSWRYVGVCGMWVWM